MCIIDASTLSYHCSGVSVELGSCSSITPLVACGNSARSAVNPVIRMHCCFILQSYWSVTVK